MTSIDHHQPSILKDVSDVRYYKGHRIERCDYADGYHAGKWIVRSYHKTGIPFADELCAHYNSLDAAKEAINAGWHEVQE